MLSNNVDDNDLSYFLEKIDTDPLLAAQSVLGITHHDEWQIELIEAVWDVKRKHLGLPTKYNHEGLNKFAVRSGHGPGKTFTAAEIAHLWIMQHRTYMPCLATAPKQDQLKNRLFPTMRKIKSMSIPEWSNLLVIDMLQMYVKGYPDWGIKGETATQPENLAGYHDDYMLVVVDEASGIREEMYPVIEGAVSTGTYVVLILISNPTKTHGSFYDAFNKTGIKEQYYTIHVTPESSTRISKKWVSDMRAKYGKDSPIVKIRCLGEFASESKLQVFAMEWLHNARGARIPTDGSNCHLVISVDVSDGGVDESVVWGALHFNSFVRFIFMRRYNFKTETATTDLRKAVINVYNSLKGKSLDSERDYFVIDSLGVGANVASELIEDGYAVIKHKGGESSAQIDNKGNPKYRNKRVECYIVARDLLQAGVISMQECIFKTEYDYIDFEAQMMTIEYNPDNLKQDDIKTKKQMISEGIKSPDIADAFVMNFSKGNVIKKGNIEQITVIEGIVNGSDYALS